MPSEAKVSVYKETTTARTLTRKIPHPPSTKFDEVKAESDSENGTDDQDPDNHTLKRRRITGNGMKKPGNRLTPPEHGSPPSTPLPHSGKNKDDLRSAYEDASPYDGFLNDSKSLPQLEAALPPAQTDSEAIGAYDAYQAAEAEAGRLAEGLTGNETLEERMKSRTWTRGRSSIYVDAFNLALSTVLEDESHLFSAPEREVFNYWDQLSYEAQYLYVRLFLRKTSTWFRIAKLAYYGDIADMDAAVEELQSQRSLPDCGDKIDSFPGEKAIPDEALPLGLSFFFAESSDANIKTLNEASSLLLLDELKSIAKDAKVVGKNKTELLKNLRRTSGKQRGLGFMRRSETEDSGASDYNEVAASEPTGTEERDEGEVAPDGVSTPGAVGNRDDLFTKKILEQTGKCIRLSLIPLKLFERVHLVFYRSTEWTEKSLTTLILAKISRRNFPDYFVSRSATIFESRSLLLEFEASLRTQFRIDNILEFNGTPTRQGLEEVKTVFEAVYPRWQVLIAKEQEKEDRLYESGEGAYLRRFSPGWVYTRIVHKALGIFAKYKEHLREHGLLCELLQQRLFHAARRGSWYSRKALLEEHYMFAITQSEGRSEEANKKHWKRTALNTCEEGLQDNECHVIYHYDLQKRIKKLEKQLRVPKREQHDFGHVGLRKATERAVHGIRIEREKPLRPLLRRRSSTSSNPRSLSRERSYGEKSPGATESPGTKRQSTKTIWHDGLDTALPVSVESMCLSHYRKVLGYKGYHSEGGILRTLFGLLFYDIMFGIYVPNVFQTAYQTCPLDLHTDAFYSARISEINHLINRIGNGEAETIIRGTWNAHAERKTCVVGVRWDDYELDDIIEIVRCWNGEALGVVMRVIAQEYGARGGGIPDLFLWKVNNSPTDDMEGSAEEIGEDTPEKSTSPVVTTYYTDKGVATQQYGKVLFSEVKSENDRLSDTQRLWISVLLNAGVEVELCHAVAKEVVEQ